MIPIDEVIFDVGGLLARTPGPSLGSALAELSPRPPAEVAAVVAARLHRAARVTTELVDALAADLHLPVRRVQEVLDTPRPLQIDPAARGLLAAFRERHPDIGVGVCSNVSPADPTHPDQVRAAFDGVVDFFEFSTETGLVKGRDAVFCELGARRRRAPGALLHVGDRMDTDVVPALLAGWRALLVHPEPATPPPVGDDRFRQAPDLPSALAALEDWITQTRLRARPALPVRAAMLLRDTEDRILIIRGPDDRQWSLPGGRCGDRGLDHPAAAAAREMAEELGVRAEVEALLWSGWSHAEASNGTNKIIMIFSGRIDPDAPLQPDPAEIAEARWVTPEEARALLHEREADRLDRIDRGETTGWQRP